MMKRMKKKIIKSNYRPISLLSNISIVYERCVQEQLNEYFSDLLSKYQCGFRQGYGTQDCLLAMIEKLRTIAELSAYGFDRKSLFFISAHQKYRKQKTRIGSAFGDYLNILFGIPQGSILGPILFIIFLTDLFYIYNDLDCPS